jgi:hypothetical protein
MTSSDISLISLGMTSFFSAFIYDGAEIETINKGFYHITNIFSRYDKSDLDYLYSGLYNNLYLYSMYDDETLVNMSMGMANFYKMFANEEVNLVNDVHEILTIL